MKKKCLGRLLFLCFWLVIGLGSLITTAGCISEADPTPMPTNTLEPTATYTLTPIPFGQLIADDVPARSGPGHEYAMFGTLAKGDMVEVLSIEGEWCKARSERFSSEVWIYAGFIQGMADLRPQTTSVATWTPIPMPTLPSPLLPTPTPCGPPVGWVIYVVQPGDTLYSLALKTGTTTDALRSANCLLSTAILAGQQLYVPRLPPVPLTPTALPVTATLPPLPTPTLPPQPTTTPSPTCTPPPSTPTLTLPPPSTMLPTPTCSPPPPTQTLLPGLTMTPTSALSPP